MTLPLDAARSPDSRLMSVVLPAPFGPSTACSLPRSMPIATPLTAASPPKRRVSATRREDRAQASSAPPMSVRRNRAGDAREPARQEDHQQDDRAAQQQLPVAGERLEDLGQRHEREGADDGAVEAAHAAQDQHQQHVAGLVPRQELRVHETELERRQVAGEARERAGQREARELVAIDREPERAHPVLVAADPLQRAAERRAQHDAQEHEHGDEQREHAVIDVRRVGRDRTA